MFASVIKFTNQNRLAVLVSQVVSDAILIAVLYNFPPDSVVMLRLAIASIAILNIASISVIAGAYMSSRPSESLRQMQDLTQSWKGFKEIVDKAEQEKKEVNSRYEDLRQRVQRLHLELDNKRVPRNTYDLSFFSSSSIRMEQEECDAINILSTTYPPTPTEDDETAQSVSALSSRYYEHHMKFMNIAKAHLDKNEKEILVLERRARPS